MYLENRFTSDLEIQFTKYIKKVSSQVIMKASSKATYEKVVLNLL